MTTSWFCRWLATCSLLTGSLPALAAEDFVLREELGRQWTAEYVTFPMTAAQLEKARMNRPLLDPERKPVPYQLVPCAGDEQRIAFQTNLEPLATRSFGFAADGEKEDLPTDIVVEETADVVRISSGKTGIAIRKAAAVGVGPIAGIKLNSGKWVGSSRLTSETPVSECQVRITARGPVMAEVAYTITFGDRGRWESRYRVFAGEPVVLVEERSSVDADALVSLVLSEQFHAERLFYRFGSSPYGKNATWAIEDGTVFQLEPWLRWQAAERRGSTFSVYNTQDTDLLTVAAGEAGVWVDPELPREKQAIPPLAVVKDETGVHVDFPLKHGRRMWMLGAFDRDTSLAVLQVPMQQSASPLPYRYLVKYGHFPLEMIQGYVLRWPSDLKHPRLLMTPQDVERFRTRVKDPAPYKEQVESFVRNPASLTVFTLDDAIPAYLATGDARLGDLLAHQALDMLQASIDYLIDQTSGLPLGAAPHHQSSLAVAASLADIMYDAPHMTPAMRDRLRAQAAFLGYTTSRPEYWSPVRGYAANPNMTTSVYGYRASLACLISDHPRAPQWIAEGLAELQTQLDTWSDDNGGWMEAPHYAMVSYDQILGVLLMAYNSGYNDWLYSDPKVKKVIQWFAKIQTPPDSRLGGFRHHPPVGNTYMNEPSGEFGLLAYLFREKDPDFSAHMQWQFKQNNQYLAPGVGGFFPAFAGYRRILTDPTLPQKAPAYASELFPQTGVVLRDAYPSDRETYLHMILGTNHAHYDDDSGSIVLYGKGRIQADEFGYYGYVPQEDHSMVESPLAGHGVMQVRDFVTHPRFDYVAGVKEGWTRQIALVKGATSSAPAYFVINDELKSSAPATWRLWLTAGEVQLDASSAHVVGKEDVDLNVHFLTPAGMTLKSESKTRTSGSGMFPDWRWGPMETTQIGVIASLPQTEGYRVVLYPRLKIDKPPTFTGLADGKGVKVAHAAGIDYVFLSNKAFVYEEGDIRFEGLAGMIQLRGSEVELALGSRGKIRARGTQISD